VDPSFCTHLDQNIEFSRTNNNNMCPRTAANCGAVKSVVHEAHVSWQERAIDCLLKDQTEGHLSALLHVYSVPV
jgi:hypothetical protein